MKFLFLLGISLIIGVQPVYASLKINEIYPAPSTGESEWVEIYNDEDKIIDLTGYTITDDKNNVLNFEITTASPSSYFLATSTNVLNNSGDSVILKNAFGEIIENIVYSDSFSADKSYSRCPDGSGNFIQTTIITKRNSNTQGCVTPTQQPTQTPQPSPTVTSVVNTSYDKIYLSEVMVNPIEESEWVELYNDNEFPVSLNNWFLDDSENSGSSPKFFSLEIPAQSYAVFELTSSMFNNSADSVRILNSGSSLKDSFAYYSSAAGNTLGKTNPRENSICVMEPTKGNLNESCLTINTPSTSSPTPTLTTSPTVYKVSPSQTVNPSIKNTIKPTIKKIIPPVHVPQSLFYTDSTSSAETIKKPKQEVLGTKTAIKEKPPDPYPLWKILSGTSASLSFLTIIIIFFRMKYKVID